MNEDERFVTVDVLCGEHLNDLGLSPDGLEWQLRQGLKDELIKERAMISGGGKRKNVYRPSVAREVVLDWLFRRTERRNGVAA